MARQAVATYKPGESFTCTKRPFEPGQPGALGDACGTIVVMHGYHWCAQVCPKCLANYFVGSGGDMGVYLDHGWFDAPTAARVRARIAANGGQYVPEFSRTV